jgi:hypothetical protein
MTFMNLYYFQLYLMMNNNHRWPDPSDDSASDDGQLDQRCLLQQQRAEAARLLGSWLQAMRIAAGQAAAQQAKLRRIDDELRALDG